MDLREYNTEQAEIMEEIGVNDFFKKDIKIEIIIHFIKKRRNNHVNVTL